jgi:hypothetical protein
MKLKNPSGMHLEGLPRLSLGEEEKATTTRDNEAVTAFVLDAG